MSDHSSLRNSRSPRKNHGYTFVVNHRRAQTHAMHGFVVQVASVGGHSATLRYYVLCGEEAEALRLMRTTFASEREWAVSVLRPVASWEVDAFKLQPGEVKQAP